MQQFFDRAGPGFLGFTLPHDERENTAKVLLFSDDREVVVRLRTTFAKLVLNPPVALDVSGRLSEICF